MHDWERSFPAGQIEDHAWIVHALEDIASYCDHHGLVSLEQHIRCVLSGIDLRDGRFEVAARIARCRRHVS